MSELKNWEQDLIADVQQAVRIRSFSDEEGEMAAFLKGMMERLGFDLAEIDSVGNVIGRVGDGDTVLHFDGHMDTVQVTDGELWKHPPFSGEIAEGAVWGRGSVDMKSGLCAALYAAALARERGWLKGKSVYVTGTVCEEYCDGENLKHLYRQYGLKPDYCVICEPSDNIITLGHKGKDAYWEVGTLRHTSWNGGELCYEPMHDPWEIKPEHPLVKALRSACQEEGDHAPDRYDFWDFGTNAITPVAMGVPCVGFGPGRYKLAHMRDEHCAVEQITEACRIYARLMERL